MITRDSERSDLPRPLGWADGYFPSSYQSSRERLLSNARAWSSRVPVTIDSRAIVEKGPSGETLALDWVQIGPKSGARRARHVLVLSSGTHGLEGFCGAGVQHATLEHFLSDKGGALVPGLEQWPDDFALVVIHAINPYGFAWLRRVNEHNVDLNRNSVAHFDPSLVHPDYVALHDVLNPTDFEPDQEAQRWRSIEQFVSARGERALQQAVAEGQYHFPRGMQFGGRGAEPSTQHLQALARDGLKGAEHVIWVDYHTGLGELGACELISGCAKTDAGFRRAHDCWPTVKSTESGDSLSTQLNGLIEQGLRRTLTELERGRLVFVSAEYGTYPVMRVLKAMRSDNWLHHFADQQHPLWPAIKAEVLEAFRPNQSIWRDCVLEAAERHLQRALTVLFNH
jgi:Protein of unknown function (DUF2817)